MFNHFGPVHLLAVARPTPVGKESLLRPLLEGRKDGRARIGQTLEAADRLLLSIAPDGLQIHCTTSLSLIMVLLRRL